MIGRLDGEEVVGPAERLQLEALRREGLVDPAVADPHPPCRVRADQAVQVALPVGRGVDAGSGQRTRTEQDVAPAQTSATVTSS